MKRIAIFLFVILISLLSIQNEAFAASKWQGLWGGEGRLDFRGGPTYQCTQVLARFERRASTLKLETGPQICGTHQYRRHTYLFQVRRGNLFYFNRRVGTLTASRLDAQLRFVGGNVYTYHFEMREGLLLYDDLLQNSQTSVYRRIRGELNPSLATEDEAIDHLRSAPSRDPSSEDTETLSSSQSANP